VVLIGESRGMATISALLCLPLAMLALRFQPKVSRLFYRATYRGLTGAWPRDHE
jgi:hypothetical protein